MSTIFLVSPGAASLNASNKRKPKRPVKPPSRKCVNTETVPCSILTYSLATPAAASVKTVIKKVKRGP